MTTPDILTTVGFEKGKIGSGEKDVGYEIKESSLGSLLGSLFICFSVMGLMVVFMVYDIHLEKKTLHRQLRIEEHHAAAKLAKVQMELWAQYRDDIQESREAEALLGTVDKSYTNFKEKFTDATKELAAELSMEPVKAQRYADRILHMVADMHGKNVNSTKHLIDHLIAMGKKSARLEGHVQKQIVKEAREEKQLEDEDKKEGVQMEDEGKHEAGSKPKASKQDPLQGILEGFWDTFNDYEGEFAGRPRESLSESSQIYQQITDLWAKINGKDPPDEEQVAVALDKIDLASIGAPMGQGRILPVKDIIEELSLIPKIPHLQLSALQQEWRSGKEDSSAVFEQLAEWHQEGLIPSGWLHRGVAMEEAEQGKGDD